LEEATTKAICTKRHTIDKSNEQTRFELWRAQKAYHTGTALPTDISWKPRPRIPSNFATMKVRPGSFVASMNS